jgi:hypothetical protein
MARRYEPKKLVRLIRKTSKELGAVRRINLLNKHPNTTERRKRLAKSIKVGRSVAGSSFSRQVFKFNLRDSMKRKKK